MTSENMKIVEEQCRAMQRDGTLTMKRRYLAMIMFLPEGELKKLLGLGTGYI